MKGKFLLNSDSSGSSFGESNIYADKSSLVLEWLLLKGIERENFTIREVAKESKVSLGLAQKILKQLILEGVVKTEGMRTAKKFSIINPSLLLKNWRDKYSILKKCKVHTCQSGFKDRNALLESLKQFNLKSEEKSTGFSLALHSAADLSGYSNTNLKTLELYILNSEIKAVLENELMLEPQERGYDVLLIEPYYKSLASKNQHDFIDNQIPHTSILLTYLDLYHFPLRGREQAEFLASRAKELNNICGKE